MLKVADFDHMLISITELRDNLSSVIKELTGPKVLISRNKPKAVLIPYDDYLKMEERLQQLDDQVNFDALADELLEK